MSAAVSLAQTQRLLGLLAQGLSGRYLHLKSTQALTGRFRPQSVTTDGASIYLPESVDVFGTRRENLGVYRIAVLHQAGFFELGTFGFSLAAAREVLADLPAERPAPRPLPGDGDSDLQRFFALWRAPALMRRLFMLLEDLRVDLAIRRLYPGARADLDRVQAHALSERPAPGTLPAPIAALEGLLRYTLGERREALVAADPAGPLAAMLDAASRVERPDAGVYDSAAAAVASYRVLERTLALDARAARAHDRRDARPAGDEPGAGDDAAEGLDLEAASTANPMFRGEVLPEVVQRQLRAARVAAALEHGGVNGEDAGQPTPERRRELERQLEADRVVLYRTYGHLDPGTRSFLYDEWDFLRQAYLAGWCRLYEKRLRGEDFGFARQVRQRHAALSRRVRRQFAFHRPESHRRVRPVSEGEELELQAVVDAVLDRRSGRAPQDRVYVRRERALREVACALLLDTSASTDFPIPDPSAQVALASRESDDDPYLWAVRRSPDDLPAPAAPPRRVIDVCKEALALMCEALETLGDSHAVYGFSGYGREEVEFYVAKDFDDRLGPRAWASIAAMKPRRSTRMGPAIRHATRKLRARDARTRLLIVVSDGFPEDHDYGPDRSDHEYGIQDTAQALREAERDGVQTFCVTVDRAGRDYLRRMCAPERYMVIDEIEALPEALAKVYRALTP